MLYVDGMSDSAYVITPFKASDSAEDLTDLLHAAYASLADMGLRYLATHQSVEITRDRIKHGTCLVAQNGNVLIGTVTYYAPGYSRGTPFLESEGVAHVGQLGVLPQWRNSGVGTALMARAESLARADSAKELALDTAESAEHLICWYARLGYRFIEYVDWEITNYRSVVMSKAL